jgi:hypothetical protein
MFWIVFRLDRIVNGEYYNGVTVLADEEGNPAACCWLFLAASRQ